jgi:TetR/AcrR family transcriptional regulator, regulator of biofilm formation and stress response
MATTTTSRLTRDAPRPTSDAPRPRGAARREALLEAVLKIVAEVGPDAVTHRRVAEVAALPLASTTYWFESKEHLLTAALELAAERDTARLLEYGAEMEQSHADPLDAVVGAITECDDGSQANRGSLIATFALLLEAARRPALQQIAQRWTEVYLLTLSRLLERAGSRDARGDAELLLGATDGLLLEQLASGTVEDLGPRLRRLAAALVSSSSRTTHAADLQASRDGERRRSA